MIYVENFASKNFTSNIFAVGVVTEVNKLNANAVKKLNNEKNLKISNEWYEIILQLYDDKTTQLGEKRKIVINKKELGFDLSEFNQKFGIDSLCIFKGQLDGSILNNGNILKGDENFSTISSFMGKEEDTSFNYKFKTKNLSDLVWKEINNFKFIGELNYTKKTEKIIEDIYHKIGWEEKVKNEKLNKELIQMINNSQKYIKILDWINKESNSIYKHDEDGNWWYLCEEIEWALIPMGDIRKGLNSFVKEMNKYVNVVPEIKFDNKKLIEWIQVNNFQNSNNEYKESKKEDERER